MKLGTRLIVGFSVVAAIAVAVDGVGIVNMNRLNNADTYLYTNATAAVGYMDNLTGAFDDLRLHVRLAIAAGANPADFASRIAADKANFASQSTQYSGTFAMRRTRPISSPSRLPTRTFPHT